MLPFIESPELVIGLCAPIGTDNKKIKSLLKNELAKYNYASVDFKVTDLMKSFQVSGCHLSESPLEKRYKSHIEYANKLRETYDDSGVLGMICCGAIRGHRRAKTLKPDSFIQNTAYLFDQFKRKEEVEVLRQVYGQLFVLISVYSDQEARYVRLRERIAESHAQSRPTIEHDALARDLIRRDEDEEAVPTGQRLRETFPLADLFVDVDDEPAAEKTISRFLQAFFCSPAISPTPCEYGMYLAKTASLRSLDLSRQIGAAIVREDSDIISLGCNEVPKSGGGPYWTGDIPDGRDFFRGRDENDRLKRAILADIVRRLKEESFITTNLSSEQLVEDVLLTAATKGSRIRDSELMDLIEFGRIIHAEMAALTEAARFGKKVQGAVLYCTTFPCHICAKHIVAAGIERVVFIEPYPKSYAEQLHNDSIVVRTGALKTGLVQFEPFIGISPVRYRDLFSREKRKDSTGKVVEWEESSAKPYLRLTIATYLQNEIATLDTLRTRFAALRSEGKLDILQKGEEIVA